MPACLAKCPIVRAQLRKAVGEAPWLVQGKRSQTTEKTKDDLGTEEISQFGGEETIRQRSELIDAHGREDVRGSAREPSESSSRQIRTAAQSRSEVTQKSSTSRKAKEGSKITPRISSETGTHCEIDQERAAVQSRSQVTQKSSTSRKAKEGSKITPRISSETGTHCEIDQERAAAQSRSQVTQKSSTSRKAKEGSKISPRISSETGTHCEVDQESRITERMARDKSSASYGTIAREDDGKRQEEREDTTTEISADARQRSEFRTDEDLEPREGSKIRAEERRRKRTMERLERRQRIVDAYITKKGLNYFEDVCTCSLSCIVRALRHDPFLRSVLASAVFFTLGFKLCHELDAWYLPSRSA